jgi:ubiquinone/menaquinone biosynthesis C-methylase UbiE
MRSATRRDVIKESVLLFLNVPLSSGSKRSHMICPIPFRASVAIVAHVLSLAFWKQLGCCKKTYNNSWGCILPSPRSKVEGGPTGARYYDLFMNLVLLGYYPRLIKRIVDKIDIQPGQSILDIGSGTGRNDCLIARRIGPEGNILGLDINKEMLNLSRKRCLPFPNVEFREQRIETPLPYQEEFDKVLVSFVLHGFEDAQKLRIIGNPYRALKPGGIFYILDYNEFELEKLWFPLRWALIHAECQLALEFLRLNLKKMLVSQRFTSLEEELFLRGHLRLLKAAK